MTYTIAIFVSLLVLERIFSATSLPSVRGWHARALLLNACAAVLLILVSRTWTPLMRAHPLPSFFDSLHPVVGGILAFVIYQFFQYWWHRARHEYQFLWNHVHQLHHSARRIETLTASYAHPFDTFINLLLTSTILWLVLGLPWQAVAVFSVIESFYDYFTHSNLRTPHWVGYFIQRPEMHRIHHEHGVHRSNYSLPLWDMLFGTHVNPKPGQSIQCGFDPEKESRVAEMLIGKDVHSIRGDA